MKTALVALLAVGLVTAAGCHWHHHRSNNYSNGYSSR